MGMPASAKPASDGAPHAASDGRQPPPR